MRIAALVEAKLPFTGFFMKLEDEQRLFLAVVEEWEGDGALGCTGIYRDLIGFLIYPGVEDEDI